VTATTNTSIPLGMPKVVTKIVTFYSDGTFTEYTPAPTPPNPFTVPYSPPYNHWWNGPVSRAGDHTLECRNMNNSQMYGVPTGMNVEGKSE
jgi:hypothetical protein